MSDQINWFKRHVDTVIVLGGILTAVLWMNGKFSSIGDRFNEIDKRLVRIETVLIMKNIMPPELAKVEKPKEKNKGE